MASNRGMPAMQEHLNGTYGWNQYSPRCCCLVHDRAEEAGSEEGWGGGEASTRFEEALPHWKSYLPLVE